jgi:hypothetical protein
MALYRNKSWTGDSEPNRLKADIESHSVQLNLQSRELFERSVLTTAILIICFEGLCFISVWKMGINLIVPFV